jgi:hypothetical protein
VTVDTEFSIKKYNSRGTFTSTCYLKWNEHACFTKM